METPCQIKMHQQLLSRRSSEPHPSASFTDKETSGHQTSPHLLLIQVSAPSAEFERLL